MNADIYYSISIHPDRVNLFINRVPGTYKKSSRSVISNESELMYGNVINESNNVNESKNESKIKFQTDGKLSKVSQKKLSRAITYIDALSKETKQYLPNRTLPINFKLSFITLTLSSKQAHTDQYLRRHLLTDFFVRAKVKWNLQHYVWRAEKQKNGNVHFHIISDCFIPHQELKVLWNNLQAKLGYIDEFQKRYGHRQPNSTDVHSLKFVRNITNYLIKYLVKNEQNKGLEGRLYGTSKSLENLKGAKDDIDSFTSVELNNLAINKKVRKIKGDYYEVYFLPKDFWITSQDTILFKLLNQFFYDRFGVYFLTN
jgi:hypothetical protein